MDKESRYELQLIDCNCNDCIFMDRDMEKFKESIELHRKWQLDHFNNRVKKLTDEKLRFEFDKSTASINYGKCTKLNKDVSFIPNHCQLDTQECFKHRKQQVN